MSPAISLISASLPGAICSRMGSSCFTIIGTTASNCFEAPVAMINSRAADRLASAGFCASAITNPAEKAEISATGARIAPARNPRDDVMAFVSNGE